MNAAFMEPWVSGALGSVVRHTLLSADFREFCRNCGTIKGQSWEPLELVPSVPSFQMRTL